MLFQVPTLVPEAGLLPLNSLQAHSLQPWTLISLPTQLVVSLLCQAPANSPAFLLWTHMVPMSVS
jgi:hypothetical protein